MARKKELRARIRDLEGQLQETVRQAHYAEQVCRCAGQLLDPANKYVSDNRCELLREAYERWKKEVPHVPYRGIFWDGEVRAFGEWPRVEFKDSEGYWHLLTGLDDKEA